MPTPDHDAKPDQGWLKTYYALRFGVSTVWVVLAFTLARETPALAAAMLVAYPAWDALANLLDARQSGGIGRNRSQMLNVIASTLTAVGVGLALSRGMHAVLQVFGVWAALSGLFQLATGVRRRATYGAQWAMMLSGAQSMLAGVFMIGKASGAQPVGITDIAPYAAFGAFYFLISAIWLVVGDARRARGAISA